MKFANLSIILTLLHISVFAQNVLISNQNYPNEPSIMMDPKQPNVLIAASNIDNYYVSLDTGRTWTENTLTSSYGVWGDPVIAVDTASNFYFLHLSNPASGNWIDRIVCQKTTDNGTTWNDGSYTGLNGTKAQDKHWYALDKTNNTMYITWTQFDDYGSTVATDSSVILFSKTTDGGQTWSAAKRINKKAGDCIDSDNTVEGAVPAVGPNGEIYVAWAGPDGIVFNKSTDGGDNWLTSETLVDNMPTGWDYAVDGIYRANGLPFTVCDLSGGANHGAIYVNWSDQRNGANNTDVWLKKSTDGGQTWSAIKKVNDDNTNRQQFFSSMAIDQTNGHLYFVFYDRRNYADTNTDVYMAISTDGGNTFINRKISESPFVPDASIFFGDYTYVTAHNGVVRPIWTRLHAGELSVWTNLTHVADILSAKEITSVKEETAQFDTYPNPSKNYFYVSYKLHEKSLVNLSVYDTKGNVVAHLLTNESKGYGKYVEKIDLENLGIPAGNYVVSLKINDRIKTSKQVIIK